MARDLAEFHSRVSAEINKGTTFDSVIPDYTTRAAKWLEKNYNFKYMEQKDTTSFVLTASNYSYTQPARLKSVTLWRYFVATDTTVANSGRWKTIRKIAPGDLGGRVSRPPETFYMVGRNTFELGEIPDQSYPTAELWYWQFTSWPTSETTTAYATVSDAQAATVTAITITFRTLQVTATAVSGANGTALASAIQTALRAADAGATVISCTWASNVLTITDTSGRVISGWSFTGLTITPTYTTVPWLVTDGEALLLSTTIVMMGKRLRDNDLIAIHKDQRDEELKTADIAETDLNTGAEDNEMQYADLGQNEEYVNSTGSN